MKNVYVNSKLSAYRHEFPFTIKRNKIYVYKDNDYTSDFDKTLIDTLKTQSLNSCFSDAFGKPEAGFWGCPVNYQEPGYLWCMEMDKAIIKTIHMQIQKHPELIDNLESLSAKLIEKSQFTYFVVDEERIIHLNQAEKIKKYAEPITCKNEKAKQFYPKNRIDFDKIRADGYGGLFYHRSYESAYTDALKTETKYDFTSICIWDSDCVHPIPKELAYIAQLINEDPGKEKQFLDLYTPEMDESNLAGWTQNHREIINEAIAGKIFSSEQINNFLKSSRQRSEIRNKQKDDFVQSLTNEIQRENNDPQIGR